MPRHSYREHDYTFGQTMLRLRKSIRLTQAGLAALLGVSRRAVGEWEAGSNYPREHHLQHLIELCVRQHVFAHELEEEEIRALWETAHQRVFLDEAWLAAVLTQPSASPVSVPLEEATGGALLSVPPPSNLPAASPLSDERVARRDLSARGPRIDWVGALDVSHFTGRERELAELIQWVVHEQCRLVAILGMGGIGKSALASLLGKHLASQFDALLWCSSGIPPPVRTWSPTASPSSRTPHPPSPPPCWKHASTS